MNKKHRQNNKPAQSAVGQAVSSVGNNNYLNQNKVIHHQVQQVEQRIQTIFDPDVVQRYGQMVSDAPDRILTVFEKNSECERDLRIKQADSVLQSNQFIADDNKRRDWMAFVLIIVAFVLACFFAYIGWVGFTAATLLSIVGVIVKGYLDKGSKAKQQPTPAPPSKT